MCGRLAGGCAALKRLALCDCDQAFPSVAVGEAGAGVLRGEEQLQHVRVLPAHAQRMSHSAALSSKVGRDEGDNACATDNEKQTADF